MSDVEKGEELGLRFLRMCEEEGATGVVLLNAMGNALVGFFMTTKFDKHHHRMKELDRWCAALKKEVNEAHLRTERQKH